MALQEDEQSNELLRSQAHTWNHIFSFIKSMSLKCAIQLEIPDIINRHGAPISLSELVEALAINKERSQCVYRLMRILSHSGFFVIQSLSSGHVDGEETEGYLLAPASRFLLKEDELSIRPILLVELDPVLMDPWQNLSKWLQNDDLSPFHTTHGKSIWDVASQDPKFNHLFNEAMASDAKLVNSVFLKHCGSFFQGLKSIVDVGSGTGTLTEAIAKAFPHISCISFDLPHVVNGLVGSENLSYVGGDMFEAIPKADAVLLKWILHTWSDEECLKVLKQCKEAIPNNENGGKVIIIEMVVKNDERNHQLLETQLFFDTLMMSNTTGRQRSEKDWSKLFVDAGYSNYIITPVLGLRSVIEVYP